MRAWRRCRARHRRKALAKRGRPMSSSSRGDELTGRAIIVAATAAAQGPGLDPARRQCRRHAADPRQLQRRALEVDACDQSQHVDLEPFIPSGEHAEDPVQRDLDAGAARRARHRFGERKKILARPPSTASSDAIRGSRGRDTRGTCCCSGRANGVGVGKRIGGMRRGELCHDRVGRGAADVADHARRRAEPFRIRRALSVGRETEWPLLRNQPMTS